MSRSKFLWLVILLFTPVPLLLAGNTAGIPRQRVRQVTQLAGYIFAGTVTSIERTPGGASAVDSVRITFHVDRAIRGVQTGQSLTIREWSGLWTWGERYHLGQQVVLCLYKPSKLGLTSPVGGSAGHIDVDPDGKVVLPPEWQDTSGPGIQARNTVKEFIRTLQRSVEE